MPILIGDHSSHASQLWVPALTTKTGRATSRSPVLILQKACKIEPPDPVTESPKGEQ
ncbi:hypothetical protein EYZ11_008156 [Aspergillus tanneri]|uniref:Uncharacterized protein n=1 Tax=Aspergillus tanneri TaxID=1220188 RepID=A0A4S3JB81_9EURO|nr:hypothetical protein EYZ11_008156 [Aspergillus tanneri]